MQPLGLIQEWTLPMAAGKLCTHCVLFSLKSFGFAFVLLVFVSSFAWAVDTFPQKPVAILVLDSPADYRHEALRDSLEINALKEAVYVDRENNLWSWYDFNNAKLLELQETVQFRPSNRSNLGLAESRETFLTEVRREFRDLQSELRRLFSRTYRVDVEKQSLLHHGTSVSEIAIRGLNNIKLLHFPWLSTTDMGAVPFKDGEPFYDRTMDRKNLRKTFTQISAVIQKEDVRVVNLSVSSSLRKSYDAIRTLHPWRTRILRRSAFEKIAVARAENLRETLSEFIAENPNVVFVLAAGNQQRDLRREPLHTSTLQAPNLLKVATADQTGEFSPASNYSTEFVDLVAPGTLVSGVATNNGETMYSGSSIATAFTTNRLAEIVQSAPELTAVGAIAELKANHTESQKTLAGFVNGGLRLRSRNDHAKCPVAFNQNR